MTMLRWLAARSRKLLKIEVLTPLVVAGLAWNLATAHLAASVHEGKFYQERFSPAVSLACGGGWAALQLDEARGLREFLSTEQSRLECGAIDLDRREPISQFQSTHKYLLGIVGLWWKAHGRADWAELKNLFALFFVLSALGAYGLLRLGTPAIPAGLGAILFAASEAHLRYLPHFRDYSKAPFILVAIAATAFLIARWNARKPVLAVVAVVGVLLARLGLGFRTDLLLLVPFALASIWLFGGASPVADIRKKLLLSGAFIAAFVLSAAPILSAMGRGGNTPHVVLLGLMTPFDQGIGVRGTYYEVGNAYNDSYAWSLINASHQASTGGADVLRAATPEYDEAGLRYLRTLLLTLPADFATRAAGSVFSVLTHDYGFPLLRVAALEAWVVVIASLALVGAWLRSAGQPKAQSYAALIVLYFSGVASLQFHERHFFHLSIFQAVALTWSLWGLVELGGFLLGGPAGRNCAERPHASGSRFSTDLARNLGHLALLGVAFCIVLLGLRVVQSSRLASYLDSLTEVARYVPLSSAANPHQVSYSIEPLPITDTKRRYFGYDVLLVLASAPKCGLSNIELVARYRSNTDFDDFTRVYNLEIDANTKFVLPVFRSNRFQFLGLEVPTGHAPCISFVGSLENKRIPFFPTVRLGETWKDWPAYQALEIEPASEATHRVGDFGLTSARLGQSAPPPSRTLGQIDVLRRLDLEFVSPWVTISDIGATVGPQDRGNFEYLLSKPLVRASLGCHLLIAAEGRLHRGGLTVGLLDETQASWDAQVTVEQRGAFRVAVEASRATGVPMIANNPPDGEGTYATITKFGAVETCSPSR